MCTEDLLGLNGLGSPFGIETALTMSCASVRPHWLNGLGSPFGIETSWAIVKQ